MCKLSFVVKMMGFTFTLRVGTFIICRCCWVVMTKNARFMNIFFKSQGDTKFWKHELNLQNFYIIESNKNCRGKLWGRNLKHLFCQDIFFQEKRTFHGSWHHLIFFIFLLDRWDLFIKSAKNTTILLQLLFAWNRHIVLAQNNTDFLKIILWQGNLIFRHISEGIGSLCHANFACIGAMCLMCVARTNTWGEFAMSVDSCWMMFVEKVLSKNMMN